MEDCITVDLSGSTATNILTAQCAFLLSRDIESIDLTGCNFNKLSVAESMFEDCSSLTSLDFSSSTPGVMSNMDSWLLDCTSLTNLSIPQFLSPGTVTTLHDAMRNTGLVTYDFQTENWNMTAVTVFNGFLTDTALDVDSYDGFLQHVESSTPQNSMALDAPLCKYSTNAVTARTSLTNTYSWTINDAGPE
jgi:hypothetical protein